MRKELLQFEDEFEFSPKRDSNSDSVVTPQTHNNNIVKAKNQSIKGDFSSGDSTISYEFKPLGYSRVVLKKNGKSLFDGTAEEFKSYSKKNNLGDVFVQGFKDGREQAKIDFSDKSFDNYSDVFTDDYDVKAEVKKAKRGCSIGCVIALIIGLLIAVIFGTGIYHIILTIIEALENI